MKKLQLTLLLILASVCLVFAQTTDDYTLLKPDRVFDGEQMHNGWVVLVKGNRIKAVGKPGEVKAPSSAKVIELKGTTLMPGLIEGLSHLFLHTYDKALWDDQVLKESRAERTARAVVHARETLMAGFTSERDLGTEGCGYDDVGLKTAIDKGIFPGPRMMVATRAIVATGSYGPKNVVDQNMIVDGGEESDGEDGITHVVRSQIGHGADIIKIYADYGWGLDKKAQPTFTVEDLKKAVEVAKSS